jgi:hypothetical protein
MKTRALKNYGSSVGCEVYDIDLNSDEEIIELGKLCAEQCIVYVDQNINTTRLNDVMVQWGDPSRSPVHNWILEGQLEGRHWREILLNLGFVNKATKTMAAVSTVSYKTDDKNRPQGLFANGELDWHSDQCAFDDAQRIIGLQSVSDTANSQTTFLCTHDAYESLSSDMQSMVKELYVKHKWRDNVMAPGLNKVQTLLIHYNMCPLDGMETRLYSETLTGLTGMKLPSHSYDGFVGMSREESDRIMSELKKAVYKDQYVYTQNWNDGQVVFMDQEITLHARPTNVQDGDKRTMARVITYLNHLFPHRQPATGVRYQGQQITHAEFAKLVDADRRRYFDQEQKGEYAEFDVAH